VTYTVVLVRDPGGAFCVGVPALKGCNTEGQSLPEALDMAREAIELYLACLVDRGEPVPTDVETVTFDWFGGSEAFVYKLDVREPGLSA
jgi:predicted RNase H-like HicB family nuclease